MTKRDTTNEQRLSAAYIVITNVRASIELQAALGRYAYTLDQIRQGELLWEDATTQYQQKIAAYGGLRSAADALISTEHAAQAIYTRHVKIARVALENDHGKLAALHLLSRRKSTSVGWIAQASQFYTFALNDGALQAKLAEFSLTTSMLQDGAQQIAAVAPCRAASLQQRGTAQHATKVRDVALDQLETWMHEFKIIARLALKDSPQLLEQLGVKVPS